MYKHKKIIFYLIIITIIIIIGIYFKNTNKTSTNKNMLKTSNITKGGTYNITGKRNCIVVNTTENVELDLEDTKITCKNGPAINIENSRKVNIILKGENTVTSKTNEELDGAIYSKDDLIISGSGKLNIISNYDGIVSKDNLIINDGIYIINSDDDGIKGKDSIEIKNGTFNITANGDGIKSTNDEEHSKGYIKINKGKYIINSKDDGIHANGMVEINDGTLDINASEGIEGTYVKINGGKINIKAIDDGINAGNKSSAYPIKIEINGGYTKIDMGQLDTDAVDSNGDLYINGGTLDITAKSVFDYNKIAKYSGGKIIVNGQTIDKITNNN